MATRGLNSLAWIGLCVLIVGGFVVHVPLWQHDTQASQEDVYFSWVEGQRILSGENPYERILAGNMLENQKYATYFPLFYLLSALTQRLGLADYGQWIAFWRPLFLLFTIGIAVLLFFALYQAQQPALGLLAAAYWLFNRWTLLVTRIGHIDPLALFFLVVSLLVFRRHRWLSFILFGVSLAVKQIGIFLLPLYLIWTWQLSRQEGKDPLKMTALAAIAVAGVPVLTSLPFLIANPEAYLRSILFSATRAPIGHIDVPSLDALLMAIWPAFVGVPARLPMLLLMGLIYLGAMRRAAGRFSAVTLIMAVFIGFNSVLFLQYISWILPFIPLIVLDRLEGEGPRIRQLYET